MTITSLAQPHRSAPRTKQSEGGRARVAGQAGETAADLREPRPAVAVARAAGVERAQLCQEVDAVADLAAVGRVEEREALDLAEAGGRHLQDHRGEVRA